jgi:hypothetical protein
MTTRSTSSEYQPSPPIVRLPGRGSFASGPKGSTGVAINGLQAGPPSAWQLVARIGKSSSTINLAPAGPYNLGCGSGTGITTCPVTSFSGGGGTVNSFEQTSAGIFFDIDPDTTVGLIITPSQIVPGYFLGQKLRFVLEWDPADKPDLTGYGDETSTGIAYQNGGGGTISINLNGIDPADSGYKRQFAGNSAALGGFTLSTGTVITENDAIQALEVAAPATTAYYGTSPATAAVLNWDTDITGAIDDTFAVDGDALLPGNAGTAFAALTDVFVIVLGNNITSATNLVGTIKALSIYALNESI